MELDGPLELRVPVEEGKGGGRCVRGGGEAVRRVPGNDRGRDGGRHGLGTNTGQDFTGHPYPLLFVVSTIGMPEGAHGLHADSYGHRRGRVSS